VGQTIKQVIDLARNLDFKIKDGDIHLVFVTDQLLVRAEPDVTAGTRTKLTQGKLGDLKKVKQVCLQIE
jgi:hypothetical protein